MAHVQKIKQAAVAPMVAHYERKAELERGYVRDNIDPERTADNYNLCPRDVRREVGMAIAKHEETAGKGIRKDANVLLDWIVTMPKDCPREMHREFFGAVARFMEGRYGEGNVLGCYVHMDEATPHAHIPILPMRDGKLVASKVVNRADLRTFHGDLGKAVDEALGMHVSIELDEQQRGEKQLSALNQTDYIAAKERLECLRQQESELGAEIERLEPLAETLSESAGALWKGRGDGEREEGLGREIEGLRGRISELEGANRAARDRVADLDRELPGLRDRCERARARFERVERGVAELVSRLREIPNTVSEWAQEIARELGKRVYDPCSLDYIARQATEDSGRNHARTQPNSRSRGER
jgi:hypothetical protein